VAFANTLFERVFLCARNCAAGAGLEVYGNRAIPRRSSISLLISSCFNRIIRWGARSASLTVDE